MALIVDAPTGGMAVAIANGGDRRCEDYSPHTRGLGCLEHALGPLERRTDHQVLVSRLVVTDGGGDMHDDIDAGHGFGPAAVGQQVSFDQLKPGNGLAPEIIGEGAKHIGDAAHRPHGAADRIAGLQEAQDGPLANKACCAGDQHQLLFRHFTSPLQRQPPSASAGAPSHIATAVTRTLRAAQQFLSASLRMDAHHGKSMAVAERSQSPNAYGRSCNRGKSTWHPCKKGSPETGPPQNSELHEALMRLRLRPRHAPAPDQSRGPWHRRRGRRTR